MGPPCREHRDEPYKRVSARKPVPQRAGGAEALLYVWNGRGKEGRAYHWAVQRAIVDSYHRYGADHMTYDLTWQDGTFRSLAYTLWVSLLHLASLNGWEPAGTEAPCEWEAKWGGDYMGNAGQRVTLADARSLADALESALPDVPTHDAMVDKVVEFKLPDGNVFRGLKEAAGPYELWSGELRESLIEIISLCRQSGFTVD